MGLLLYPTLLIHKSWRQHRMTLRPLRYESFLMMLPFKVTSNLPSRLSIKRIRQSKTMCGMRRKVNQFLLKYFPFISTGTYFHFYSILYNEIEESCLPEKMFSLRCLPGFVAPFHDHSWLKVKLGHERVSSAAHALPITYLQMTFWLELNNLGFKICFRP